MVKRAVRPVESLGSSAMKSMLMNTKLTIERPSKSCNSKKRRAII